MNENYTLSNLQTSVRDRSVFTNLNDYFVLCNAYLALVSKIVPTRIVSPTDPRYIFYQYDSSYSDRITRPLNTELFIESPLVFQDSFKHFLDFLSDLKHHKQNIINQPNINQYFDSLEINRVIYTIQQCIGCIGDSFDNPNQSRKRIGQLFENLVRLVIQEVDIDCESRTVRIPLPDHPDRYMSYELDLIFSRDKALVTSETQYIHPSEVVGSVKTTSKDRIDKIFFDKFMISKLLGRDVPVIAIFLHDVQRARRGDSIFGINSTFKRNHFLGYTYSLNPLKKIYYVDPRPEMLTDVALKEYIHSFQDFLVKDLWSL